jgi:hypothetical protein
MKMLYKLRELFDDEYTIDELSRIPREKMEVLIEARVEHVTENADAQANKKFNREMKKKR